MSNKSLFVVLLVTEAVLHDFALSILTTLLNLLMKLLKLVDALWKLIMTLNLT